MCVARGARAAVAEAFSGLRVSICLLACGARCPCGGGGLAGAFVRFAFVRLFARVRREVPMGGLEAWPKHVAVHVCPFGCSCEARGPRSEGGCAIDALLRFTRVRLFVRVWCAVPVWRAEA